ncbi:sporulation protein YabP [Thermoflavimicrobium dichotomicum]|uniref:Sporulation protein YabP n=1 Tax=Thermoflavimicrobium dichotomicum TaxID=46223 RepID=A0A1I3QNP0_9BACL|nr:sporulation protein YabP [Thermoflavimicrobium dichotomicum]SFJ35718.1 sporulation protein YabP [Thermoflavimicrobium dichotomicum]
MVEQTSQTRHEIVLVDRKNLEISGVVSVESFDNEEFLLQTDCGFLGVRGQDLHIKNLDLEQGLVSIEGHLVEFNYLDAAIPRADKNKGLLGRLFR